VPPSEPFFVHSSALARIAALPDYRPVNLPAEFEVETQAGPPAPPIPPRPYRPESAWHRLKRLFSTWPAAAAWRAFPVEAFWLAIVLAVVGGTGGFVRWDPDFGPALLEVAAWALGVALFEQALFRAILLKPPSDGASNLGPAALSAFLSALWHPLQVLICQWNLVGRCPLPWSWLGFNPWFLIACFALGFACARLVLRARSIWPAVLLHWLVILAWYALFGGPGLTG
jgi:uncharacterized protein